MPKWTSIRAIIKQPLISTSFIWLIITPVAANLLNHIDEDKLIWIFDETISIKLALPFSWVALFFAALFFSTAKLIYSAKCPPIISIYDGANDAWEKGMNARHIIGNFTNLISDKKINQVNERNLSLLYEVIFDEKPDIRPFIEDSTTFQISQSIANRVYFEDRVNFDERYEGNAARFNEIFNHCEAICDSEMNLFWRGACLWFLILGVIPSFLILIQSTYFVTQAL